MKLQLLILMAVAAVAADEPAPPVKVEKLTLGDRDFSDVTITPKDAGNATLRHAGGVATVSLADLPEKIRKMLGDVPENATASNTKPAAGDAGAAKPIEGAFGLKLGDVFDAAKAVAIRSPELPTPFYEIKPAGPLPGFQGYHCTITPTTHRIISIGAAADVKTLDAGRAEEVRILELLEGKYGKAELSITNGRREWRITSNNRNASLTGPTAGAMSIMLVYRDERMAALAIDERKAINAAKADASGL